MLPEQRVWRALELKAEAQKLFHAAQADEKMVVEYETYLQQMAEKADADGDKKKKSTLPKAVLGVNNTAFVFVKPHATAHGNTTVIELVRDRLLGHGITVKQEGEIDGTAIANGQLVDQHYYAIANRALLTAPTDLSVSFEAQVRASPPPLPPLLRTTADRCVGRAEEVREGVLADLVHRCP
jgi:hypothetical protein